MTAHAHWDKSSLVLRGKLIREKLFCTVLPPPPPDVNNTLPQADPKVSTRERFEDHRSDIGCAKCHRLIDPLGIPFENYDGIGAWRTNDGPAPVDPTSEIAGTAASDGPVKDALELTRKLAGVRTRCATAWRCSGSASPSGATSNPPTTPRWPRRGGRSANPATRSRR